MSNKLKVGIIGATGMVGQKLITLLQNHPWFEVKLVAASKRSSNMSYEEAVKNRWKMKCPIPENIKNLIVQDANNVAENCKEVDFVFCAVSLNKEDTKKLEEDYAKHEVPVISNNSANRNLNDVPMLIPEINYNHTDVINEQKKRLGTKKGFISVKPNCSIQTYVPALTPLLKYNIESILACTYQAISGSGKTFKECPEILDNVIPYIPGEEEKSEMEPLKIWGHVEDNKIVNADSPVITTQCIRVPVENGHLAAVYVKFKEKITKEEIIKIWNEYESPEIIRNLPSSPKKFIKYMSEDDRPQTKLDRDFGNGMGITIGRLREDSIFDFKFVSLSHNTVRGAAGGSILSAELLKMQGYLY